ncbi:MAG: thiamine-phosphate kinase, partial [Muribaculaceae bacterium]|nr:thiamine-phosphate kinase [Muribaculaceae bacterium]
GEDYELLFTVPLHMHDEITKLPGINVIGNITKPELGCCLVTRDDTEMPIRAQGWNHMAE